MKMLSSNEDILTTAAIKKTGAMLKIKNKQYTCAIADRMVTCGLNGFNILPIQCCSGTGPRNQLHKSRIHCNSCQERSSRYKE